jgi:hypothetical protein
MAEQVLTNPDKTADGGVALLNGSGDVDDGLSSDDVTPEQIEQAREQGWRPEEEYDGPADKFIGAKEYLDRAEHILPIIRSRDRDSRAQISALKAEVENLKKDSLEAVERATANARREFRTQYDDLKKLQAQAVSDGDGEAFARIGGEMEKLVSDSQPKKVEIARDEHPPALKEAGAAFQSRNTWFEKDERKTRVAMAYAPDFLKSRPDLKGSPQFFPEFEKALRVEYPEVFGNTRRAAADPMVEGDARPAGARQTSKKSFRDLPKDAQEAAKRQVRNNLCKNEQEYVDNYFAAYGEE